MIKKCKGPCGRELEEIEEFFSFRKDSRRFRNFCKKCRNKKQLFFYSENADKIKIYNDGRKDKRKEYDRLKNIKNSDKNKLANKKYREEHKEECKAADRKYYQEHKNEKREYDKKRDKSKRAKRALANYHKDPIQRTRTIIATTVRSVIKLCGAKKNGSSVVCNLNILTIVNHLEAQFFNEKSWMTWENIGSYNLKFWDDADMSTWRWQIDHIVPQYLLPYDSMEHINFKKSWDLRNLRPLSAKANNMKSNKIEFIPEGLFTPEETEKLLRGEKINCLNFNKALNNVI